VFEGAGLWDYALLTLADLAVRAVISGAAAPLTGAAIIEQAGQLGGDCFRPLAPAAHPAEQISVGALFFTGAVAIVWVMALSLWCAWVFMVPSLFLG
jgi:hypothetical protein